jgi:hypothetical protein
MWQRFHDWRHERYIGRLMDRVKDAQAYGDLVLARLYWDILVTAINARSPARVARMERRKGLA